MNLHSTDEERYEEIKDKVLHIPMWNINKEDMLLPTKDEKPHQATKRFANELQIHKIPLHLVGENTPYFLSNKTIKESIHQCSQNSLDLSKLFTVIDKVVETAVLIAVEEYKHIERDKSQYILEDKQYLSAFMDERKIYPVKITLEKHIKDEDSIIYMIVSVGKIERRDYPRLRVHPYGESVVNWDESLLDISIADLVKTFNKYQEPLIKCLPDKLLNEEQQNIKEKIINKENQRIKDKIAENNSLLLSSFKEEGFSIKLYDFTFEKKDYYKIKSILNTNNYHYIENFDKVISIVEEEVDFFIDDLSNNDILYETNWIDEEYDYEKD